MTAFLLLIMILFFALHLTLRAVNITLTSQAFDYVVSPLILLGLTAYSYVAVRAVYADRRIAAALRAVAIAALVTPLLFGYRFLLFFITLKTMH